LVLGRLDYDWVPALLLESIPPELGFAVLTLALSM